MDTKLFYEDSTQLLQRVVIECSPVEYLVIQTALKHMLELNTTDIERAEKMSTETRYFCYTEKKEADKEGEAE